VVDLPFTTGRTRSQTNVDSMSKEEAVLVADEYLKSLTERLDEGGLANLDITVKTEVESDPDIAEAIIKQAEGGHVDLMAMATHGRGGMQHFVMGSVTERVLHHSKLPLLIVRPSREQAAAQDVKAAEIEVGEVDAQTWVGLF
jgi:nucleotide-binding universal stress UspA family protein